MIEEIGPRARDAQTMLNEEGPWGSGEDKAPGRKDGPRNPWLQPPRRKPRGPKGEGGQPSLEELIRRGRDRFNGLPGGGRPIWGLALAAFVALWLISTSITRIEPQDRGVVTRFGRFAGILQPGINLTAPAPIDVVTRVDVADRRNFDVPASGGANLLLTRDQSLIDLAYTVNWSVRDPDLFLFNLPSSQEDVIRNAAQAAMREAVAGRTFDQVAATQADLAARVTQRTQDLLDRYHAGVLVQGVTIREADLPSQLADAAKDIADARAAAQADISAAKLKAADTVNGAQRQAQDFDRSYAAYKQSPQVIRSMMYYNTMEDILAKAGSKAVVDASNVTVQLPPPAPPKKAPTQGAGQ